MVVVITATGGVTKRIFPFPGVVDPKLAEWGNAFLNEQLTGVRLGGRTLVTRLDEPGLSTTERAFLDALRPAFTRARRTRPSSSSTSAAAPGWSRRCTSRTWPRSTTSSACSRDGSGCSRCSARRSTRQRPYLRIGADHTVPYMRGLAMVAANYGLATRNLGTVSLIGPRRMDYAVAIQSVRGAAHALSEFVAEIYEDE